MCQEPVRRQKLVAEPGPPRALTLHDRQGAAPLLSEAHLGVQGAGWSLRGDAREGCFCFCFFKEDLYFHFVQTANSLS